MENGKWNHRGHREIEAGILSPNVKAQMTNEGDLGMGIEPKTRRAGSTGKGFVNEKWKVENGKSFYLYIIYCE